MTEGNKIRVLELQRSSLDLKVFLKGHGLTIKAVSEANDVTPANIKKYWAKKLQHNPVAKIVIGGYLAVAIGVAQQE